MNSIATSIIKVQQYCYQFLFAIHQILMSSDHIPIKENNYLCAKTACLTYNKDNFDLRLLSNLIAQVVTHYIVINNQRKKKQTVDNIQRSNSK